MNKLHAVLISCFIFGISPVLASPSRDEIRVNAQNVEAGVFLVEAAKILGFNVIVGPKIRERRIDVSGSFRSKNDLILYVSELLSANLNYHEGVAVLKHPCSPVEIERLPLGLWKTTISLNFRKVSIDALLDTLLEEATTTKNIPIKKAGERTKKVSSDSRRIAAYVNGVTMRSALEIVASTGGFEFSMGEAGDLARKISPADGECTIKVTPRPVRKRMAKRPFYPARCESTVRICNPLETYKLETFFPIGYIYAKRKYAALAESSDGLLWTIRQGDYIGKNFGKVLKITDSEMEVHELLLDEEAGDWRAVKRVVYFRNESYRTLPR